MNLRRHAELMARYHRWAFELTYVEVDALSEADYRRDVGLYFKSIHGTLNHLLLVDHLWHGRLVREPYPITSLADEIEPDRGQLKARLLDRSQVWLDLLATLEDEHLAGTAEYLKIDGTPARLPRASAILHVFNHGTHHRGQISTALTQLGRKAPEIDLPYFLYSLPPHELGIASD
jgi:uncharacterized damage-inducible protein DinB